MGRCYDADVRQVLRRCEHYFAGQRHELLGLFFCLHTCEAAIIITLLVFLGSTPYSLRTGSGTAASPLSVPTLLPVPEGLALIWFLESKAAG